MKIFMRVAWDGLIFTAGFWLALLLAAHEEKIQAAKVPVTVLQAPSTLSCLPDPPSGQPVLVDSDGLVIVKDTKILAAIEAARQSIELHLDRRLLFQGVPPAPKGSKP